METAVPNPAHFSSPFAAKNPLAFSNRMNECLHDNSFPGQQVMLSVLPQQLNATRQAYQP